jgi:tight adherence protein C
MTTTTLTLMVALLATAAAISLLVFALTPDAWSEELLRGQRDRRRQAALAENSLLRRGWPLIRLCTFYGRMLPLGQKYRDKKGEQLRIAGEPWGLDADEFLGLQLAGALLGLVGGYAGAGVTGSGFGLAIIGGFLGLVLPELWLMETGRARLLSIRRGLPGALDLVVMSMSAGLDFTSAVRHVVEQWSNKRDPLCEELSRFLHELSLGKRRSHALEDLAVRAPTSEMRSFVVNAVQSEIRGTPLLDVLRIQAEVARTQRFQSAEQSASKAGVKMLAPLLCVFATTLIVLFGGLIVKGCHGRLVQ